MSDLKLFRTADAGVAELPSGAVARKSLQTLFKPILNLLLGVRFLAPEFTASAAGRM